MDDGILINKTGRAVVVISVLVFSICVIVWILLYGKPDNSLHTSALSWSYTLIVFTTVALGINAAAAAFIGQAASKTAVSSPK